MTCTATLVDNVLTLATRRIRRVYDWNGGRLRTRSVADLDTGLEWTFAGDGPDLCPAAIMGDFSDESAEFRTRWVEATPRCEEHLEATVEVRSAAVAYRQIFRLFPDSPAIGFTLWVLGCAEETGESGCVRDTATDVADCINLETGPDDGAARRGGRPTLDRLALPGRHWRTTAVEFFDVTDRRNNLVFEQSALPYNTPLPMCGNVLLMESLAKPGNGLFWVKEAPCSSVQLGDAGADFEVQFNDARMLGIGLTAEDLRNPALCADACEQSCGAASVDPMRQGQPADGMPWIRAYGASLGVAAGGRTGLLRALREHEKTRRRRLPGRDDMVLMNTWGDRNRDAALGEAFALAELERGHRLGITHFQLDDGWQRGRSHNSAFANGAQPDILRQPDFWTPHPERFPNGLGPVVERGRELGIEVCLWFNPSAAGGYAGWRSDADALISLYREYGIRTFKIDGVNIPDKLSDVRMRRMLDTVCAATGGDAVFNLDVTAMRRFGFHYFGEYGNLFLENRYTDWGNYYPHWTLRNLWQLAAYVPPEALQVEFLNNARNGQMYDAFDPFAPQRIPFATTFAIAMAAQPLAWFEARGLKEEAFEAAPVVKAYAQTMREMHDGVILPVGDEPDGWAWTGFQSMRPDGTGFLLVIREGGSRSDVRFRTRLAPGTHVCLSCIAGAGTDFCSMADVDGCLSVHLPTPWSFALYRY